MAFTRRPPHQSTHVPETEHTEVEVTESDVTEPDDEVKSPAKAVFTAPVKTEVEVKEVNVDEVPEVIEEKLVTVVPHVTLTSVRIGPKVYSFLKGVPVKVPSGVKAHLQEKGII